MISTEQTNQLRELLAVAHNVLIIFPDSASYDQVAIASALFMVLRQDNKDVRLLSPMPMVDHPQFQSFAPTLVGLSDATSEIGNQNLTVSFEYNEESVDKVSYHIGEESQRFYLTIKPKRGAPPLDTRGVEFSYTGAEADAVILVGVQQLDSLGQLYFGYEDLYKNSPVISINTFEPEFGLIKLDTSGAASQSEVVTKLLLDLQLTIPSDSATNLLSGIEVATDGFRSMSATAQTFEMVAKLLQLGARRMRRASEPTPAPAPSQVVSSTAGQPTEFSVQPQFPTASAPTNASTKDAVKKPAAKRSPKKAAPEPGSLNYQPSEGAPRG